MPLATRESGLGREQITVWVVLIFLVTAAAIVFAGATLARNADIIAARTRLGGQWVGLIFLALATSLPELATDITAVRLGAIDLAAGDLFGSSMANMLLLALVSVVPGADLFRRAALDNALSAALAITLTCLAALFILVRPPSVFPGVGVGSILLAAAYVAGSRIIYQQSTLARVSGRVAETARPPEEEGTGPARRERSLRRAIAGFVAASLLILVAAPFFASSARDLADLTGLGASFIGTWLVGIATSLPELVTSFAAVRMGAYDLAVGNLFGSNAANMVIFLPLDLVYPGAPLLSAVSSVHLISALIGVVLMGIALAAIVYRAKSRFSMLEPNSLLLMLVYVLGIALIYYRTAAG